MSMIYVQVLDVANSWWKKRKDRGAHHFIIRDMPFLFEIVEALYLETSQTGSIDQEINKDYVLTIGMSLPAKAIYSELISYFYGKNKGCMTSSFSTSR